MDKPENELITKKTLWPAQRKPTADFGWILGSWRFCDPTNVSMLQHARCVAAEQSSPSYLVLGMFKTSAQHPGSSRTSAG